MVDVIARLQKIRKETHIAQDLLDYALEDTNNEVLFGRTVNILNVLQDKLCEIDGLQQSLLSELTEKENALDGETNTIQGHETKTIDKV